MCMTMNGACVFAACIMCVYIFTVHEDGHKRGAEGEDGRQHVVLRHEY